MPHQCVRCSKFYEDGAEEIIKGCSCGGKLFFYIRKEKLDELSNPFQKELTSKDKLQIETDVFDIIGQDRDPDSPIVLDLEAVRVVEPGKYELDLIHLFKNDPLVYKIEEGKYIIDLTKSFKEIPDKPKQKLKE